MADTTITSLVNQPRTILGPLTEVFTQPDSCTWAAWLGTTQSINKGQAWMGKVCYSGVHNDMTDPQNCWPPTTAGAGFPSTTFHGWGFYSPGLICPTGFTSACSATADGNADWPLQFSLVPSETAVGCCPSGFTCTNFVSDVGQACVLKISPSTSLTTATCDFVHASTLVPGFATYPITYTYSTVTEGETVVSAYTVTTLVVTASMIQINWQSSDRDSSGSTPTSSTTSGPSGNGISTGAIAGAVIGSIVGLLVIAAAVFFVWRHKRRSKLRATQHVSQPGTNTGQKKHPQELYMVRSPVEMDNLMPLVAELPGHHPHIDAAPSRQ